MNKQNYIHNYNTEFIAWATVTAILKHFISPNLMIKNMS